MSEYTAEDYATANKLNAQLALSSEPALIEHARALSKKMIDHVRAQVPDYEDFLRRVHRSEEFALHESAQVPKKERDLKLIYMRATGLSETAAEAAARATRRVP